jgi:hypothetical protein
MSSRQKNRHKSRHRTHPIKPANLAKYAPGRMLLAIQTPAEKNAPVPETEAGLPADRSI